MSNFSDEELAEFKKVFNSYDKDGNGSITVEELSAVVQESTGEKPNRGKLMNIIAEVDDDKSGTIEWEEFLTVISKLKAGTSTSEFGKILSARDMILQKIKDNEPKKINKTWKNDSNKSTPEGKYKSKLDLGAPPAKKSITDLP